MPLPRMTAEYGVTSVTSHATARHGEPGVTEDGGDHTGDRGCRSGLAREGDETRWSPTGTPAVCGSSAARVAAGRAHRPFSGVPCPRRSGRLGSGHHRARWPPNGPGRAHRRGGIPPRVASTPQGYDPGMIPASGVPRPSRAAARRPLSWSCWSLGRPAGSQPRRRGGDEVAAAGRPPWHRSAITPGSVGRTSIRILGHLRRRPPAGGPARILRGSVRSRPATTPGPASTASGSTR